MQRRGVFVLAGATACLGALSAVAGSVDAPAVAGGATYEVTVPWEALLRQGDAAAGRLVRPQSGESADALELGPSAVRTYLGQLVVLTGWLLVAFRTMDRVAGVLSAVSTVVLAVVLYALLFGVSPGGESAVLLADVPVSTRYWVLSVVVVAASAAVAFSLPARVQRSNDGGTRLPSLGRLRTAAGAGADATTREPSPSNPVEQAWWDLTRRVDADSWATSTPREVERRAAEADLPSGAVRDLRTLFEEVRYGGAAASDERAARARELRDRLEGRAGGDTDRPSGDATGDGVADTGEPPDETGADHGGSGR